MKLVSTLVAVLAVPALWAQTIEVVKVQARRLERSTRLPGEILPYQKVALRARVAGFVERVDVDRGSAVKAGQVLAVLSAPEMTAQLAEAQAKAQAIESQRAELEAKAVAAQLTYERLKAAAATPGAVAGHEIELAEKALAAARASQKSLEGSLRAARASVEAIRKLEDYLTISAPFDGVITARYVHPGALAGPAENQRFLVVDVTVAEREDAEAVVGVELLPTGVVLGTGVGGVGPDDDVLDAHLADEGEVLLAGLGGHLRGDFDSGGDPIDRAGLGSAAAG